MPAVRKQVLDEIIRILREEISWEVEPGDMTTAIPPDSIFFRKISTERDINKSQTLDPIPSVRISMPFSEPIPESAGENAHDEYQWRFLAQITDSDNWSVQDNIATYLLWQEKICRKLNFKCLDNVDAFMSLSTAAIVDVVDERYWIRESNFKAGVQIVVRVWMTRISDGTTL